MAEVIAQRVMPEMKENHSADPTVWQTMNNPVTAGQAQPEMSRPGSGTVHASSNVAASHLLGNYLT